jgi:diguanylate cyclase (GGDEF)-like protein/PAS domain S-box-containing protein
MTEASPLPSFEAGVLEAIGHAVVVSALDRRILYWNRAAEEMFGWTSDEVIGRDVVGVARAEEEPERDKEVIERLAKGDQVTADYSMVRRDGTRFPVLATLTPLFAGDRLAGVISISTDITERKIAAETAQRLSLIVESSGDAIIGMDLEGTITSWNESAERIYGYTADEAVGRSAAILVPGPVSSELADGFARWRAGERVEMTAYRALRKDGSTVEVDVTVSPVADADGVVFGSASIARDVTQRRALEQAAEEDLQRLLQAQSLAQLASFELDPAELSLRWPYVPMAAPELEPLLPHNVETFLARVHPEEREIARAKIDSALTRGDGVFHGTFRATRPGDEMRWWQIRTRGIQGRDGALEKVIGTVVDVTERHRSEAALREAEERFRLGFERGAIATAMLDLDGIITSVNPVLCQLLGRNPDEVIGHEARDFVHPDEETIPIMMRVEEGDSDRSSFERRFVRPDGVDLWGVVNLALVRHDDGNPAYLYAQVQDITERKAAEQALEHMALHDPLTGLPNRMLLGDRLEGALARSRRYGRRAAIVFGDIDRFKLVNDTLGHGAGDQLLVEVARRLQAGTRVSDTVGRFGGDEFVMICEDVGLLADAGEIGRRMTALFEVPFRIDGQSLYVTISCGIVLAGEDDTPATCLRDADAAMYRAKELGRARTELFDTGMRQRAARILDLESALRLALEGGDLRVAYQPIIELDTSRVLGVEALLRWDHPTHGTVGPSEFVPVAEQAGLVSALGRFVIGEAVDQIGAWRQELPGGQGLWASVNLSAKELSPELVAYCEQLVEHRGVAGWFGFEITESVLLADIDAAIGLLARLHELGIPVSIDDFGTGYSSLEYLNRLPVSALKIDQSFVAGLGSDSHDPSIVHAVVNLAQALHMTACAEGVETEEQRRVLMELGCPLAQGFYWSPALSPEEFSRWYQAHADGARI